VRTRAGGEPHEPAAGKGGAPARALGVELTPAPTPFGAYVESVQTATCFTSEACFQRRL